MADSSQSPLVLLPTHQVSVTVVASGRGNRLREVESLAQGHTVTECVCYPPRLHQCGQVPQGSAVTPECWSSWNWEVGGPVMELSPLQGSFSWVRLIYNFTSQTMSKATQTQCSVDICCSEGFQRSLRGGARDDGYGGASGLLRETSLGPGIPPKFYYRNANGAHSDPNSRINENKLHSQHSSSALSFSLSEGSKMSGPFDKTEHVSLGSVFSSQLLPSTDAKQIPHLLLASVSSRATRHSCFNKFLTLWQWERRNSSPKPPISPRAGSPESTAGAMACTSPLAPGPKLSSGESGEKE